MSLSILLVDDDMSSRLLLAEFLTDSEYDVTAVEDCQGAVAAATEKQFDIAILDMNLPDGTGLELLGKIRPGQEKIKVFMLTGEAEHDVRDKCEEQNVQIDGCITKPFSLVGILGMIESVTS